MLHKLLADLAACGRYRCGKRDSGKRDSYQVCTRHLPSRERVDFRRKLSVCTVLLARKSSQT
jgi:hypothetical protein